MYLNQHIYKSIIEKKSFTYHAGEELSGQVIIVCVMFLLHIICSHCEHKTLLVQLQTTITEKFSLP